MTCSELREILPDFLFGELSEEKNLAVRGHLAECADCREEVASLQQLLGVLREVPEISPAQRLVFVPQPARRSFWPRLRERFLDVPLWRWGVRAAFAAVLAVLFILGTRMEYRDGQLTLSFGRQKAAEERPVAGVSPELVSLLKQWQSENLYLTSQLIAESEKRQQEVLAHSLQQLATQIQQQRMEDLQFVAENLLQLQKVNEVNFDRTNSLLRGLVQFAAQSYRPGGEK